jgi:hypothetical protein
MPSLSSNGESSAYGGNKLSGAAIEQFFPGMWRVFGLVGLGMMLEVVEGSTFDAAQHENEEVNGALVI